MMAEVFLKNAWYCAGWDYEFHQGRSAIIARKIANERVVLYRKPDGGMVALEDRCPHRYAALSLGRKEGAGLRCMYHGLKFDSDGVCDEIPGQSTIPPGTCVRAYPVVEKDNWVWVWMGEPAKADPALICFSVGPGDPNWHIRTSQMHVKTNYRREIENLADLSHIAWVHPQTVGGDRKYSEMKSRHDITAKRMNEKAAFDDIARQFILLAEHTRDSQTGLYYHAWDESKLMPWANKETGCSPSFWGRAMGWFVMGLVDVLDYFPQSHPKRKELVRILREATGGILKWRDSKTSLWYLVLDKGDTAGNYLEASSACMFTYAIAKGARMGYLEKRFFREAQRSFDGIIQYHVTINPDGVINLHHTIKGAGLGGNPYRDGTLAYYTGESQRTNDMKGLGPFLLAAIEIERGMPGRQLMKK